jgi:hypothetical protein
MKAPTARRAGIPSEAEYVGMYCRARGVPPPDPRAWSFFMALSLFRAAAILAGVGARAKLGNASSERAAQVTRAPACTHAPVEVTWSGPADPCVDGLLRKQAARSGCCLTLWMRPASGQHLRHTCFSYLPAAHGGSTWPGNSEQFQWQSQVTLRSLE